MANTDALKNIFESNEKKEGKLTKEVERQTAKVPSVVYLNLAFASIAASLSIAVFSKKAEWANFVGMWAPAFMLMGIYNKLVKQQGSD